MATIPEAIAAASAHHQAGRLAAAEQIYRQVLAVEPNQPDALHLLGVIAWQVGKPDEAVQYIERAIRLKETDGVFHSNLGNAFLAQWKLDEAIACYRRALELRPDLAEAHSNLGSAFQSQGKPDEAVACHLRALELRPDLADAHNNLGNALKDQGKLDDAIACYHRALALKPDFTAAHSNLGNALQGQWKLDEAIACYRRALELRPDLAEAHSNLGNAFRALGKLDEAIACYHRALELKPDFADAQINLGNAFQGQGKVDEALACCRQALELKPDHVEARINLGHAFQSQGKLDEAVACYRRALELRPDLAAAHSTLLYTLHFCAAQDAKTIYAEHRRWNERFAEPLAKFIQPHLNERTPHRRLRIGYVSPGFREGATALFLLPLLEAHDHEHFEIFCYASVGVPNVITDRCRAHADVWRDVIASSDEQLAHTIRQDRIDILVDLTMHSPHNRLLAFARKPAPVQVTYLAYPGTTGLSAMDYRLTDSYLDPPSQDASIYSEESIRLPETYWCYRPLIQAPPANALPALQTGHITFGCLNNFCKVTASALTAWISLLRAMPEARLLLHAHAGSHCDRVRDLFAQQGVSPGRLTFAGWVAIAGILPALPPHRRGLGPVSVRRGSNDLRCALDGSAGGEPGGPDGRRSRRAQHLVECGFDGFSGVRLRAIRPHRRRSSQRSTASERAAGDTARAHAEFAPDECPAFCSQRRGRVPRDVAAMVRQVVGHGSNGRDDLQLVGSGAIIGFMTTIPEVLSLALEHHQAGRLAAAEQIYRQVLAVEPNEPHVIQLLGVLAHQVGKPEVAVEYIGRAIALDGTVASFHYNLGNAFRDLAKLDEAVVCYRRALELKPDYAEAHNNLGNAFKDQGKPNEAVACYRRALELKPDYGETHNNLGNAFQDQGMLDEAVACYRRALELKPDFAEAHSNLGNTLKNQRKLDEAVAYCRRALELKPELAETHNNLGNVFRDQGKLDEAIACYRRTLELKPDSTEAHNNLGDAFRRQGKLNEAIACCHRALELKPDFAEAHNNLGNALQGQGKLDEAIACYRRTLELKPDFVTAHSNLLYTLHFCADQDAKTIYEEHHCWNQRFAEPLEKLIQPHPNERSADRRLRLGYVSPGFREGATALFLLPLLEAHDHERFEIYCYASVLVPDTITDHCRDHADVWRCVLDSSDEQLAHIIRQDQIDVLVDLTMHAADNRLLVFARKPAPVQVTYLAYAGTTGLSSMDYRLTDPYLDPPGQDKQIYCEESIRLPETYWCYRPLIQAPPVNPLPALETGHITFGCLNNFCKVTAPTLAAWTGLMQAMPETRLMLHAHSGKHRDQLRDFFAQQSISPERLIFTDWVPMAEYFELYHHIDLALDPFPYGGGTTTCDALWMGVPVVSLAGQTAVGRGGLSILSNVGLADLVAYDSAQYVRVVRELANDLPRLSELRATLRERMQSSPLLDAPRFARHVEAAYREMWRRWCAS